MNCSITGVHARQILDSRGRPTVEADVMLGDGSSGRASVPSGASTGRSEAHELRDGDPARYGGRGVLKAIANVNGPIARALSGRDARDQVGLDSLMRELDGTPLLGSLGANAVLAVSLAIARAAAAAMQQPFWRRIQDLAGVQAPVLPLPMVNILSGGLHAGRGMDVQDFLAIPARASSMEEAIHVVARVRDAATEELQARGLTTLLADEGGVSPGCASGRDALELMLRIFERAGLRAGEDVVIAIDVASTTLLQPDGRYRLAREGRSLDAAEMIDMLDSWVRDFPVVSIEDGLAEEEWDPWAALTRRLGTRVQLVGDDLFTTHPARLQRGLREAVGNGVLVKANQNGTLSGTLDVIATARGNGYAAIVSARSGETEDAFMADLAVGAAAGQIKIGSLRTSSTVAKYNQLLRLAEALPGARYAGLAALAGRP